MRKKVRKNIKTPFVTFMVSYRGDKVNQASIYWNKDSHEIIGEPEWVELFVDRDAGKLLFSGVESINEDAFSVRRFGDGYYWGISAWRLINQLGITLRKTKRFEAIEEDGMLMIDIGEFLESGHPESE
jgi:hypothetical protein